MNKNKALHTRAIELREELEQIRPIFINYAEKRYNFFKDKTPFDDDEDLYFKEQEPPSIVNLELKIILLIREHDIYSPLSKVIKESKDDYNDYAMSEKHKYVLKINTYDDVLNILIEHLTHFLEI